MQNLRLTYPQQNIWLVEKVNKDLPINSIVGTVEINAKFDEKICNDAINYVIKNNDAMRINIVEEGEKTYQTVKEFEYKNFEVVDLSLSSESEIEEYINGCVLLPLFIDKNELFEFKIFNYGSGKGAIFMKIHHIISDAWSCSKIGTQLIEYMQAKLNGEEVVDEIKPSYVEFIEKEIEYENSEKYTKDEEYWKEYLKDVKEAISLSNVTNDMFDTNAKRYNVKLDENLNERINEYCKTNKVSPYALFMGALATYLYRVKEADDFVIGTPILNRSNFKEKQMLGMFISTIPMRIKITEGISFVDLAKEIGRNNLELFRHQKYPYPKALEYVRNNSDIKTNLYNIVLSYQNARADMVNNDVYSTTWAFVNHLSDELQIHVMDMDNTGVLNINYDYKSSLFSDVQIKYLHERIMAIIEDALSNIDVNVEDIRIMSKVEEEKILYEFNNTVTDYPKEKTVIELFEEQVEKNPDKIALVFEDKEMTYRELNEKTNALAHYLRYEKGIKNNDIVALLLKRGFNMIVSILGILKAGGAYLPIDSEFPEDRIRYILENSKAKLLIKNVNSIDLENIQSMNIDTFDFNSNNDKIENINTLEDLVYIIYTSGTTGTPKGVMITHENLLNLLYAIDDVKELSKLKTAISITKYTFDMFVIETLVTLFLGNKIIIANESESIMPNKISELVNKYEVQIMFITPSKLALITEKAEYLNMLSSISKLTIAGEKFSTRIFETIKKKYKKIDIYNGYGPSEATVCTSVKKVESIDDITIGAPINNLQTYILDKKLRLLPIGEKGELYISGSGLGKGYLNNNKLNEEVFIKKYNKKIYKSGDLSAFDIRGELLYFGRKDNQIKINGQRIELEEIERKIDEISFIDKSIVLYVDNALICFFKLNNIEQNNNYIAEIKQHLFKSMPYYMIPHVYYKVDKLPINSSGKVDKNKLLEYRINENNISKKEKFNILQTELKNIIEKKFNKTINSLHQSFFELGLDSLDIIKLSIEIDNVYNKDIVPNEIMINNTIFTLSELIKNKSEIENINEFKVKDKYPLSSAQMGIFTNYFLDPDNLAYNIPFEMKFSKNINIEKLRNALKTVIESTDIFFTKLEMINGNVFQRIDKNIKFDINVKKISNEEYDLQKSKFLKSYDLLYDNLFDVNIYETEENIFVIVNIHHIIFDGLSMNIFLERLKKAYENEKISEDKISFGQFALYDQELKETEKYKIAKDYFNKIFSDELPDNNMVYDKKRKKEKSFKGDKLTLKIDNKLSNEIKEFAIRNDVTLNSTFLSMFNLILAKYMYANDVIVGVATSGREFKEKINKMGMFVKTVPFRAKINIEDTILNYIKSTQANMLETIDNSIYPFETLVKDLNITRDSAKNPLFDIMFVYQNTGMPEVMFENEEVILSEIPSNTTKFDITCEVMPNKDAFDINIEYSTDLFYEETIRRFGNHYINALKSMLNNNTKTVKDIDILSESQKKDILNELNNTKTCYPNSKSIVQLVKEQVNLNPNKTSVVFEGNSITYNELDVLSDKLAYRLYQVGVKKGDMIPIMMDKSLELIISILAILKVGAIYVPIELDFPKARIKYILEDINAKILLINSIDDIKNIEEIKNIDVNLNSEIYKNKIDNSIFEKIKIEENDTVYVMYTSGTTGNPKGVMVNNKNVIRLVKNTNYISFNEDDKIILTGAISFDASTFEIWGSLLNDLELHLVKKDLLLTLPVLEEYVKKNNITVMWLTSKLFNNVVEYNVDFFDKIRCLLVGGDTLSIKHINILRKNNSDIQIINGYGPTENTTFSTCYKIESIFNKSIPIGKPIANSTCYILDKTGNLCYTNMPGELVVGGDGISNGYLNNKKMNDKSFVKDIYSTDKNAKMYKTGDLVYLNRDGNIEFCGRIDTQVKIRGFRIEPEEINQILLQYDYIKESIVVVENHNGKKIIVAYYTSDIVIDKNIIVKYLKENLPQYMIPTYFINITKIPLNNNGKADKNKLFSLGQEIIKNKNNKLNTELYYEGEYLKVYELFKEVLQIDNINYDDNFFDIGGDSLMALRLVTNAIARDIPITYQDLFKYPTIKELGDMLSKTLTEKSICEPMYSFDYSKIEKLLKNNVYNENIEYSESLGNVLLTGVTGFLGAHILDEFMKSEKGKIYCVIRNKNGEEASERLKKILNFFFGDKYDSEIGKRIFVIKENISEKNKIEIHKEYINDIDIVINSAACVKHFGEYELFEKINVRFVESLIDFCVKYNKKMIQISTLSISGNLLEAGQLAQTNVKPDTIFNENNLFINQNLDNVYAYTKYLGEKLVYDAIISKKLKGKVMRMGNLTGRTNDGKFQPNVSENAFANRLKTMLELKVLPNNMLNFYLEFTPIDYAARAVLLLSKTEDRYNTYHLFNHNHAMLYFVDSVLKDKLNISLNHITKEEMTNLIETLSKQKDGFEKIKGIVLDVNKNKELEYVSNIIVKSDFSIKVLKKMGFEWPKIEEDYIEKYLGYLFDIGFLKKEGE